MNIFGDRSFSVFSFWKVGWVLKEHLFLQSFQDHGYLQLLMLSTLMTGQLLNESILLGPHRGPARFHWSHIYPFSTPCSHFSLQPDFDLLLLRICRPSNPGVSYYCNVKYFSSSSFLKLKSTDLSFCLCSVKQYSRCRVSSTPLCPS